MENLDTNSTQYDGAINKYLDANKDNQFNLETTAIAASRVFSIPQNTDALESAKKNPAIIKMWDMFQKGNELQKATIDQIIEVQKASHSFIQLINKREMLQAAAIITVKNQLNTLSIENQQVYETIKKLASNVLQRFTQLERKLEHVEAIASLTQWIQNLKWRKYNEDPYTKRFFRILEDFYVNSGKNFTMQNLESLKTAFDQSDIDPFKTISLEEFTTTLVDELIEHGFNESMKHSPYNEKYSFKEINSKITLPFLSSLYLLTEEYNHHMERRYSVDRIRDDIKQAALCYMREDCGIDVLAKLEYYHLGIELLNGRRLIEFLDSPAVAVTKTNTSVSSTSTPVEIDTSQERYKEYMDLVVMFLKDEESTDVIDDEERGMLKTKQKLLKLSDEEARKIEESVINNQNNKGEAERKYKEEARKTLADNPEVTTKKRVRLDLAIQSLGLSPDTANKCEEEIIAEINTRLNSKTEEYRKIVRSKLEGTDQISPKIRIFLDLKIQELGLGKEIAEKCENEEMEAIEQGADADKLYDSAWKYYLGDGVSQDMEKSFKLCEKAVDKGNPLAAAFLADFYQTGTVVKKDYKKEHKLWQMSYGENENYTESLFMIDAAFMTKKRIKDVTEAVDKLKKEALEGNIGASYILASAYREGVGTSVDCEESAQWIRKAAEQGSTYAQFVMGKYYSEGIGVKEDKTEAVKWYRKAADQGHPLAQVSLGNLYLMGIGVSEDPAEAVKWYRKAVEQEDSSAQAALGNCYFNGFGISEDKTEAKKWYHKSADQNDAISQHMLGIIYRDNNNLTEAVKWFRKAAEQNVAWAQLCLAECYDNYEGIQNQAEAKKWYKAFSKNSTPANVNFSWGVNWGFLDDDIWIKNDSSQAWDQNKNYFLEVELTRKNTFAVEFYKILRLPVLGSYQESCFEDIMSIEAGCDENIRSEARLLCVEG